MAIRVIPYSAVQVFAYETYKKLFRGKDGELSVLGRLAAGACAGMTSTLVTYPLDVLRLRLAVEPGYRTMSQVALSMLMEEGIASFYNGLGLFDLLCHWIMTSSLDMVAVGSKFEGSQTRMRDVACPTCTVHLQVKVKAKGESEAYEG